MSTHDYLGGAVLFGAMLAAVILASRTITRRRLAHLDALERGLAGTMIGTSLVLAVHIVPMALGILGRGSVIVASAIALLAARAVPAAIDPHPGELLRPARPVSSRNSWILALIAAAATAAEAAAQLKNFAGKEIIGVDPLTFHLPDVARWIQTGSLWQIDQFLPGLAHGDYPNNGDTILLSAVLPWHNDFLARFPITFFMVVAAVAVYALARELGAAPATCLLAAAVFASLPVVGLSTIPRAMPDEVLYAGFSVGTLFLLRHLRTGRRSDLALAAIALGIAFGTKWYGVSCVGIVAVAWATGRLLSTRRPALVARESGVIAGGVALMGGIWLLRNLVESANPLFPVKIAPLGVTIFDAPRDRLREQTGFSISDYFGNGHVMGKLAGELIQGLGAGVIAGGLALVIALVLSGRGLPRRPADARVLGVTLTALVLTVAYVVTPYSALGLKNHPDLADANTRYLVPALLLAIPLAAWAVKMLGRRGIVAEAGLAASAIIGAESAYPISTPSAIAVGVASLILAACVWGLWIVISSPRRGLVLRAGAAALILVGAVGFGQRAQKRVNSDRYLGPDPAIDIVLRAAPSGRHIGLAGVWSVEGLSPIWPSFGTRIGNDVEYVGHFVHHLFEGYGTQPAFDAALRRGGYDLLVVGRGLRPPEPVAQERWALAAGWRTLGVSTRLRVLLPPR